VNQEKIKSIQAHIGTTPDGFWGVNSIAALQKHLRSLMPSPNSWPKSDQASLTRFYGDAGDESRLARIDVSGLGVQYEGNSVTSMRVNRACSESLLRVITAISSSPFRYILGEFGGVFNNRPMRGGALPSLHARGAAIDLAVSTNGLNTHWPTRATMPIEVMEMFAREGWLPAGAFWSRDAMHFQATR
jgi:hypothetical protein